MTFAERCSSVLLGGRAQELKVLSQSRVMAHPDCRTEPHRVRERCKRRESGRRHRAPRDGPTLVGHNLTLCQETRIISARFIAARDWHPGARVCELGDDAAFDPRYERTIEAHGVWTHFAWSGPDSSSWSDRPSAYVAVGTVSGVPGARAHPFARALGRARRPPPVFRPEPVLVPPAMAAARLGPPLARRAAARHSPAADSPCAASSASAPCS